MKILKTETVLRSAGNYYLITYFLVSIKYLLRIIES